MQNTKANCDIEFPWQNHFFGIKTWGTILLFRWQVHIMGYSNYDHVQPGSSEQGMMQYGHFIATENGWI